MIIIIAPVVGWPSQETDQYQHGARCLTRSKKGESLYRKSPLSHGLGIRPKETKEETPTKTPLPCEIGG